MMALLQLRDPWVWFVVVAQAGICVIASKIILNALAYQGL